MIKLCKGQRSLLFTSHYSQSTLLRGVEWRGKRIIYSNTDTTNQKIGCNNLGSKFFIMGALFPFNFFELLTPPETLSGFQKLMFYTLILTILTLWSFVAIIGHFLVLYLINHTKLVDKYPKFKPVINYFKKTNYIFLTIEIIYIITIYVFVIAMCIYMLYFSLV